MAPLLQAEALTKLYGVVIGVNDVTLELEPGVIGLLGPNGAGKSTLLKLITGQLRPTVGSLRVLGERPWSNTRLYGRLGFCPEQDAFYDTLTAHQFVTSLGRLSGLGREAGARAEAALEMVGAGEFMHRPIGHYSRGMRQRTKVAQAIVHDPPFLILDEPLNGTDPVGRREIMDLVIRLGREGKSILVSSHVLHEVQAMTDDFVLIYGGRILASGGVREIRSLMDEFPHRITIRCGGRRRLARAILAELPVAGIDLDGREGELASADDSLEAVFNYLVSVE
jgi:ABC-2 type transport system ATP-binding protein